jgi:hypothetical protein
MPFASFVSHQPQPWWQSVPCHAATVRCLSDASCTQAEYPSHLYDACDGSWQVAVQRWPVSSCNACCVRFQLLICALGSHCAEHDVAVHHLVRHHAPTEHVSLCTRAVTSQTCTDSCVWGVQHIMLQHTWLVVHCFSAVTLLVTATT